MSVKSRFEQIIELSDAIDGWSDHRIKMSLKLSLLIDFSDMSDAEVNKIHSDMRSDKKENDSVICSGMDEIYADAISSMNESIAKLKSTKH